MPFTYNFVDGIGAPFVNEEMFDLARELIDGLLVVSTEQTAGAMRLIMERNPVIPEQQKPWSRPRLRAWPAAAKWSARFRRQHRSQERDYALARRSSGVRSREAYGVAGAIAAPVILGSSVALSRVLTDYPLLTGQTIRYGIAAVGLGLCSNSVGCPSQA